MAAMREDLPEEKTELQRERRNLAVRLIFGLILVVLFLLFISANSDPVPVSFVFTDTEVPLIWVFLACALIGALVAYLLGRPGRRNTKKYIKELERRIERND